MNELEHNKYYNNYRLDYKLTVSHKGMLVGNYLNVKIMILIPQFWIIKSWQEKIEKRY